MRARVIVCMCFLAYGAGMGWLLAAVGAPPIALVVAVLLPMGVQQVYCRYVWPARMRGRLGTLVDPAAGPPEGSEPVASQWPDVLDGLARARNWGALAALLADDFAMVDAKGRRYDKRRYIATIKAQRGAHGTTEAMVAHPQQPGVLWVRSDLAEKPRFGPGWAISHWTRFTFTPDGARLREIASAGVVQLS